jgi:peptidyl-tRNA hydrolase, PTH1 family
MLESSFSMIVWIGLGNPGKKYAQTRHNAGILILSSLLTLNWKETLSLKAYTAELPGHFFIFPVTYMNHSGQAIAAMLKKFAGKVDSMVVFHDEIELPPGDIKVKESGGHKGHNGLRDIIKVLGHGDFFRIRIGVGRPEAGDVAEYVLSTWPQSERPNQELILETIKNLNISHPF